MSEFAIRLKEVMFESDMELEFLNDSQVRVIRDDGTFVMEIAETKKRFEAGDEDAVWALACEADMCQADPHVKVTVQIPLLESLGRLCDEVRTRFFHSDSEYDSLVPLGLYFFTERLRHGGYCCTPVNTVEFARTGQDGEHFSLVVENEAVTLDSPVVYTFPTDGPMNFIVAGNFEEFVRLGLVRGFFALHDLSSRTEALLKYLSDAESRGYVRNESDEHLSDREFEILQFLSSELDLTPKAYSFDRFEELQELQDRLVFADGFIEEWCE